MAGAHTSLLRLRTRLTCQLHALVAEHGVLPPVSDIFGAAGKRYLTSLALPEISRRRIDTNVHLAEEMMHEVKQAERELRHLLGHDDRLAG